MHWKCRISSIGHHRTCRILVQKPQGGVDLFSSVHIDIISVQTVSSCDSIAGTQDLRWIDAVPKDCIWLRCSAWLSPVNWTIDLSCPSVHSKSRGKNEVEYGWICWICWMDLNGPNSRIGVATRKVDENFTKSKAYWARCSDQDVNCVNWIYLSGTVPEPKVVLTAPLVTFDTVSQVCVHMVARFYAPQLVH